MSSTARRYVILSTLAAAAAAALAARALTADEREEREELAGRLRTYAEHARMGGVLADTVDEEAFRADLDRAAELVVEDDG